MSIGGNPEVNTVALFSCLFTGKSITKTYGFIGSQNPFALAEIVDSLSHFLTNMIKPS